MSDPQSPLSPPRFLDERDEKTNALSIPVVRDPEFRRYCPNAISIWAIPYGNLAYFDLILQRMETVEKRFHFPGDPKGSIAKDVKTEVYELAIIQLSLEQLINLRSNIDLVLKGQSDEMFIRHGLSPDAKILK